jgi:hypothetical protein
MGNSPPAPLRCAPLKNRRRTADPGRCLIEALPAKSCASRKSWFPKMVLESGPSALFVSSVWHLRLTVRIEVGHECLEYHEGREVHETPIFAACRRAICGQCRRPWICQDRPRRPYRRLRPTSAGNLRLRRHSFPRNAGSGSFTHGNDFQSSSRRRRLPLPCSAPHEPSDTGPRAAAFRACIRLPPCWLADTHRSFRRRWPVLDFRAG